MRRAAAASMIELQLVSAFRSIDYQLGLLERKLQRGQAIDAILAVSAAPGYSEHHSGRALDLTTPGFAVLEEDFEKSPAFAWLQRHAVEHGFHLSFPRGNPHGVIYEPWHWCWRRAKTATGVRR
jgi:D-alanyl-D-alanine carboxypeptidase